MLNKELLMVGPEQVVGGYTQGITGGISIGGDVYSMLNSEGSARYLTFDPPRRVLGSKYTQTDLGRGYYVEEAPWEAQYAEQGTSIGYRESNSRWVSSMRTTR